MTVAQLIEELNKVEDKEKEVYIPDSVYEPSGVEIVTRITDLFDGFDKKIGIVIV